MPRGPDDRIGAGRDDLAARGLLARVMLQGAGRDDLPAHAASTATAQTARRAVWINLDVGEGRNDPMARLVLARVVRIVARVATTQVSAVGIAFC